MRVKDVIDRTEYYKRLAQVESSGNPNATTPIDPKTGKPRSTASGLYQFIEPTWKGLVKEMGLDYTLEDRFDPEKSLKVLEYFTNQNAKYLKKKLGREPNEAELYIAHFGGMGTAGKLANLAPDDDITKLLSDGQIKANREIFEKHGVKNIKQFYDWTADKFDVPKETRLYREIGLEDLTNLQGYGYIGIFEESLQNRLEPKRQENSWESNLKQKIQKRNNLLNIISSEGFDLPFVENKRSTFADKQEQLYPENNMEDGGEVKVSSQGLYQYPMETVLVPTQDGRITMKGINYPVRGISQETGEEILMQPGGEYQFKNTKNVLEIPQFQKGGEYVNYATPEYEKAYKEGRVQGQELDGVTITADKRTGKNILEDYPYYDQLTPQEKEYFRDDSPIGAAIRRKAQTKRGLAQDTTDFVNPILYGMAGAMLAPHAIVGGVTGLKAAGAAAAPFIKGAMATSLPGLSSVPGATIGNLITATGVGLTANEVIDSNSEIRQSIDKAIENPTFGSIAEATGNSALTATGFLLPGSGTGAVKSGVKKGIKNLSNIKTSVPPQARHNLASNSILPLKGSSEKTISSLNNVSKKLPEPKISINGRETGYTYNNKQGEDIGGIKFVDTDRGIEILGVRVNEKFRRQGYAEEMYRNLNTKASKENKTVFSEGSFTYSKGKDGKPVAPARNLWEKFINNNEAEIVQEMTSWGLPKRIYRFKSNPSPDIGKNFKSEIDWIKWSPDAVNNPDVVKHLNDIERATKADGTWMKNADGTAFKGTPEQFVVLKSDNVKKAFPEGYDILYRSSHNFPNLDRPTWMGNEATAKDYSHAYIRENMRRWTPSDKIGDLGGDKKGIYQLIVPRQKSKDVFNIDAKGKFFDQLKHPDINQGYEFSTRELEKWLLDNNYKQANVKNINASYAKTDYKVVLPSEGNYPKSLVGNIMMDMTNNNLFKALVPAAAATGAMSTQNTTQSNPEQFQKGGQYSQQPDFDDYAFLNEYYNLQKKFQVGGPFTLPPVEDYIGPQLPPPAQPKKPYSEEFELLTSPELKGISSNLENLFFDFSEENEKQGRFRNPLDILSGKNPNKYSKLDKSFSQIHSDSGKSCLAGAMNCSQDFIAENSGLPGLRTIIANSEKDSSKYKIPSRDKAGRMANSDYRPNQSIDAWEIHDFLIGEKLGESIFTRDKSTKYSKDSYLPEGFDYRDIPLGAIIGQGESSGVYTSPKDGQRSRHALIVVGFDTKDDMPMVYDYGKLTRLDKLNPEALGNKTHKINRITVPNEYKGMTADKIRKDVAAKKEALGLSKMEPISYGSDKKHIKAIEQGVNEVAEKIAYNYELPASTVTKLASILPGLSNQESKINNNEGTSKSLLADNFLGNTLLKSDMKSAKNRRRQIINFFKDDGVRKQDYQLEIEAYKKYPNDENSMLLYFKELKEHNDSLKYPTKDGLFPGFDSSVGPFALKDPTEYTKNVLGIEKSDLYGLRVSNEEELRKGSQASLAFLAENFNKFKNKYGKELTEDELIDLTLVSYNNNQKAEDPEFIKYYIKDKSLKDLYLEKVKGFKTK